ncbi:MAG: PDZ domain-containing protein, partial [Candidatus Promineifilaceae bacterium]|nr:PDZ domain-containing protein [Candidatus Promineifilaceae bacterium]
NEEYTLTKGIISKAAANGESNWASVDHVLETDAAILGGNSGGPLVDGQGRLVGVNYAGNDATRQNFSISRDTAIDVIEELRLGNDVDSIGINGQAIVSDDGSIAGIWVASVASGSPADGAGVQAGDILTRLEGLVLGTDGTMADYCDILRSHEMSDVMSIEILRLGTGEILAGQLNGNALEAAGNINLGGEVAQGDSYDSYMEITDNTGALKVDVPESWSDIAGDSWVVDDIELGPSVMAAPDLNAYLSTWNAPGMFFGATDDNDLASDKIGVLDAFDFSGDCTYDGRVDYDDGLYFGAYDIWSNCAGTGNIFVVLSATPEDDRYLVMVQAMVTSTADEEALERILDTFIVSE